MAVLLSEEKPCLCYQCGKCSAGCPVSEDMDLKPHQIMHLLAIGDKQRVLESNTPWICAGCFTCAVRCPNDIDIATVMDDIRQEALAAGITCPKPDVLKFHRTFLSDIGRRGRIYEMRLMGEYNMRTFRPFHNMSLAPKMVLSRRLHLLPPHTIKGFKAWMKKLWKK